LILQFRVKVR